MKKSGFLYLAVALAALALIGLHPAPSGAADCTSICQNCHTAESATLYHPASTGAPVMCIECHQQNYVDCSTGTPAHSGADWTANIVPIACVGCHNTTSCGREFTSAQLTEAAKGLHGVGSTGDCTVCHATEGASPIGHVSGPGTPSSCTQCHTQYHILLVITAANTCAQCHDPAVGGAPYYSTADLQAMLNAKKIHQTSPDLVVSVLTAPTSAAAGATITIGNTTKNQGVGSAGASTTSFYLSADTVLGGDTLLGSDAVSALASGASESGTTDVNISGTTAAGYYYIIAKADNAGVVTESNETNNTTYKAIRVGKPDLVVSGLTLSPATVNAGDSISVTDITKNQGTGAADASTTSFYLSANSTWEASDTELSPSRSIGTLGAGLSSSGTTTGVTIPGGTTAGYYYIIAKADSAGVVGESNENNNTTYKAIRVVKPDLVVSALSLSAATVVAGGTIDVTDTTRNNGTGAAGASTTSFYLSLDTVLGGGDILLSPSDAVPALTAFVSGCTTCSSTDTTGVNIPVGTTPGYYYIIANADSAGVVVESLETNNTRYSASKIQVTP